MMAALPNNALIAGPQGVISGLPATGPIMRHRHPSQQRMQAIPYNRPNFAALAANNSASRMQDATTSAATSRQVDDSDTAKAAEGLLSLSPFNSPVLLSDARSLSTCVDLLATPDLIGISHPIPQEQLSQSHTFWSSRPPPSLKVPSPQVATSPAIPWPSPTPTCAEMDEGIRGTPEDSKAKHFFADRQAERPEQERNGASPTLGMGSMLRSAGPTSGPCGGAMQRRPSLTCIDMLAGR